MEYFIHILVLIGIYIILSTSLNLIAGYTGLLSIAHAAFFGIGGYVSALLALNLSSSFTLSLMTGMAACGVFGAIIGFPSLRLRDDNFVIATFAFQIIAFSILNNWASLTGGPMGLPGIPRPAIFGITLSTSVEFLILTLLCCALTLWINHRIIHSPFGRVLQGIREDEMFTRACGKNVAGYKMLVFITGSGMAATAGVLYAYYISFIDPTSFTIMESIFIISMVIIGGAGSMWGPVAGTVIMVILPEILRFIGMPGAIAANMRQILYGGALIACMMWRPQGIMGRFALRRGEAVQ